MNRLEREQADRKVMAQRDDWLKMLEAEGLRRPDEIGICWAKWLNGSTMVIVRFGSRGTASLDAHWIDPDGIRNGLCAPKDAHYVPWLARDVANLLEHPGRETAAGLCRAHP